VAGRGFHTPMLVANANEMHNYCCNATANTAAGLGGGGRKAKSFGRQQRSVLTTSSVASHASETQESDSIFQSGF